MMQVSKSWKSSLKKKGAIALTAFVMGSSLSVAFAEEYDNNTDSSSSEIVVHDKATGDYSEYETYGDQTPGNEKTVTGYQTDRAVGYAANITWGNMEFVYDRGKYDTTTGTLVQSDHVKDLTAEMGADTTKAGFWYGFDGENNAVEIENLSTEAVKLTATPKVDGEHASNVKFKLYVQNSDNNEWYDDDYEANPKHAPDDYDKYYGKAHAWSSGGENAAIGRTFAACEFDNHGEKVEADRDFIYLNITGRPDDGFMDWDTYQESSPKKGEKLGTITLSFATIKDKGLTVKNGDTGESGYAETN